MKIRRALVSNSSSSSFIIYGINISIDDVTKYAKLNFSENKDYQKILTKDDYEIIEFLNDTIPAIEFIADYEDDSVYVGRSFETIKDDETGKMFKDSVEEFIKEHFPENKCSTIDFEICS